MESNAGALGANSSAADLAASLGTGPAAFVTEPDDAEPWIGAPAEAFEPFEPFEVVAEPVDVAPWATESVEVGDQPVLPSFPPPITPAVGVEPDDDASTRGRRRRARPPAPPRGSSSRSPTAATGQSARARCRAR